MYRLIIAVGLLIGLCGGCARTANSPDEISLRAPDAKQMRIIVEEDAPAQSQFMHANYMVNAPSNRVIRKPQLVEMLARGAMASDSFQRTIEDLQITGDVGVVMGRETVTPSPGSELNGLYDGALERRFTNIFLFENGALIFLARQASVVSSR